MYKLGLVKEIPKEFWSIPTVATMDREVTRALSGAEKRLKKAISKALDDVPGDFHENLVDCFRIMVAKRIETVLDDLDEE